MSENLEALVWDALRSVRYPGLSRDIVSFGFVEGVEIDRGRVAVRLKIRSQDSSVAGRVKDLVEAQLEGLDGVSQLAVSAETEVPKNPHRTPQQAIAKDPSLIPEVHRVVAVASGKGGVGKSTVSVNLAVSLASLGYSVGLLDADIYGPSIPMMMGLKAKNPLVAEGGKKLLPFDRHGVKIMSLGFILDIDTPVIWRGPMVMKAIEQLLGDVNWGKLDFLIVDLPPGTGDAQLTLTQKVPLSGAVIVTTPQDVALIDARKGLAMFNKVNVPVLGIVENMSSFVCPGCGTVTDIFKKGGGERTAKELGCNFLGAIPLDAAIAVGGDSGEPIVVTAPDGAHSEAFRKVAEAVAETSEVEQPRVSIS